MLVVSGDAVPVAASSATASQRRGSMEAARVEGTAGRSPSASRSHAHAMRHGWRIACSPPGRRTGRR